MAFNPTFPTFSPPSPSNSGFRLWRAKVVGVEDTGDGRKKIMVQPVDAVGDDAGIIEAITPSHIPITDQGSSFFAYPDVDSECICADYLDRAESVAYILSYIPRSLTSTDI